MPINSGTTLIEHGNEIKFQLFLLNEDENLTLPVVSHAFRTAISSKGSTEYKKTDCSPNKTKALFHISKNKEAHSFVWHTTGAKIQEAVRWGIIKPASLTGAVIATLGHYRLSVHERVCKGMATATQSYKLTLLTHFQERLSALSALESLVNKENSIETFKQAFAKYRTQLNKLTIPTSVDKLLPTCSQHCNADVESALKRLDEYWNEINTLSTINPANRARGKHSILEFVKKEAMQALYELQGLNQGITYSKKRSFALTRGELDEDIVDALKIIDDHRGDPRNQVTAQHHYQYPNEDSVSYYLDPAHLKSDSERQALMAISFIEGWDRVDYGIETTTFNPNPTIHVYNHKNEREQLTIYKATKWRLHKNVTAFRKSVGYFFWNAFKNFFISIKPWEGEAWDDANFHLTSHSLIEISRLTKPLIKKIFNFIKEIYYAVVDLFKGIRDFGYNLVVELPAILVNDWESTNFKFNLEEMYNAANQKIQQLHKEENQIESSLLNKWAQNLPTKTLPSEPTLTTTRYPVELPYALNSGELNDILNSVVRGLDGFMSVFTHNIYSKDPVAGVLFTLAYMSGGAALLLPDLGKILFGEAYIMWFTKTAKTMAATPLAGTIAAGSTQAQVFAWAWDVLMHGPKSNVVEVTKEVIKDPLTISLCFAMAYGVGYVLANGINGVEIPGLSESLREEAGSAPETSYPITGAKVLITFYEILHKPDSPLANKLKLAFDETFKSSDPDENAKLRKIKFCFWLASQHSLSKLDRTTKFMIEQHIGSLFDHDEATSLKKFLYPVVPRSIAYQLLFIPLSYIQATIRFVITIGMSMVAWIKEKPHPWKPMQRAGQDLTSKVAYDLNRLLVFTYELLRMIGKGFGCVFKAFVYSANFVICRIASLLSFSPDHAIHRGFAGIHRGIMRFREWIFPARISHAVNTADPVCTALTYENSYRFMRNNSNAVNKEMGTPSNYQAPFNRRFSLNSSNLTPPFKVAGATHSS